MTIDILISVKNVNNKTSKGSRVLLCIAIKF